MPGHVELPISGKSSGAEVMIEISIEFSVREKKLPSALSRFWASTGKDKGQTFTTGCITYLSDVFGRLRSVSRSARTSMRILTFTISRWLSYYHTTPGPKGFFVEIF